MTTEIRSETASILSSLESARQALESAKQEIESSGSMTVDEYIEAQTLLGLLYTEHTLCHTVLQVKNDASGNLLYDQVKMRYGRFVKKEEEVDVEALIGIGGYLAVFNKYNN